MDNLEELESNPIFLQRPNKNRALEQHVLSSIRGILDMLKVSGDEIDGIPRKIKDEYDEHGGYDD